jgi:hypothetical protein
VRIHHRTVQEFLAAEHIVDMATRGLPRAELEALLFRPSSGRTVVPPHLTAVTAWVAAKDPDIRRRMMRVAPEHLIDLGDPSALAPDDRRTTLKAYAERFGDRAQVYHYFDPFGLQRFACRELVETVKQLMSSAAEPDHLKRTLLRIVDKGSIDELADAALGLALAPATSPTLRAMAIQTAADAGHAAHRKQLAHLATEPSARDCEVLAPLLDSTFPSDLTSAQLLALLMAVERPKQMIFTGLGVLLPQLPARCTPVQRRELLDALTVEMKEVPEDATPHLRLKHDRRWLCEFFVELLAPNAPAAFCVPRTGFRRLGQHGLCVR